MTPRAPHPLSSRAKSRDLALLLFATLTYTTHASAQQPPNIAGVYQSIPNNVTLPGGLKNSGSPNDVSLTPATARQSRAIILKDDPWRTCQPVGQFRMMAREGTKVEFTPEKTVFAMLYEDVAHGLMRTIYLNRGHIEGPVAAPDPNIEASKGTWFGDQIAHWENTGNAGDKATLVIDSTGFNTRTWLNDHGAQHSDALHLIERIRPILAGKYLEYKMTAEDPMTLAKPYTYTRYFEKLTAEIEENVCQDKE